METRKLRSGYTTGSCAAAAAKGSVLFLLGIPSKTVTITLPKGESATLPVAWQEWQGDGACTAIAKNGGDDPDVTSGLLVVVYARWTKSGVTIRGGSGVGTVTKPGLPVRPGEAAINPVPRKMIQAAVQQVCPMGLGVELTVTIPGGERVAHRTFNPRLGIVGGLSVLGTTGIVVPRSIEGFLGTIAAELSVLAHQGIDAVVLTPGNYGRQYARKLGFPEEMVITYGNFLGFALERVLALKIEKVHLIGELGKMVKVAGGIFLTDSRVADARMEIMAAFAAFFGVRQATIERILRSSFTEEVLECLEKEGVSLLQFGHFVAERVRKRVLEYTQGKVQVAVEIFSLKRGFLGKAE